MNPFLCLFLFLGFIYRGGLAERAERFLSRSSTNFSLWQAGFAKQLEGAKHTREDLRLRISSILSHTRNTTRSFSDGLPRTAIARCTEVLQDGQDGPDGPAGKGEGSPQPPQEEGTVVFLFADHASSISSAVHFKEGREVRVWRPWQEIELPEVIIDRRLHLPAAVSTRGVSATGTGTTGTGTDRKRRTALLCSRFLVSM